MSEQVLLPAGRIVWGNPAKAQIKTNYTTKQPVLKDGQKVNVWECGVAYTKEVFNTHIWPLLYKEASTAYPNGQPRDFAWKFTDGDTVDDKGRPYSDRDGYAGHVVLKFSTEAFAPPIYKFENGAYRQISENEIKAGDYVRVECVIKAHTNNAGGIYINPTMFQHVGYGPAIVSAARDPNQVFGGQQPALPPGASATPIGAPAAAPMPQQQYGAPPTAPAYAPPPAMPVGQPAPAYAPPQQQAYAAPMPAAQPAPAAYPAPAHDYVQNMTGAPSFAPPPAMPVGNPAAPVAAPVQPHGYAPPQYPGTAPVATGYPTNGQQQ